MASCTPIRELSAQLLWNPLLRKISAQPLCLPLFQNKELKVSSNHILAMRRGGGAMSMVESRSPGLEFSGHSPLVTRHRLIHLLQNQAITHSRALFQTHVPSFQWFPHSAPPGGGYPLGLRPSARPSGRSASRAGPNAMLDSPIQAGILLSKSDIDIDV
jgi:hypothetical protein